MRYASVLYDDIMAGNGLCISFYTQGCPHHCPGCHNPETWDFKGGKEFTPDVLNDIVLHLHNRGIDRDLCILGGEPLCPENAFLTNLIVKTVKEKSPSTKIYIWSGYSLEDLLNSVNPHIISTMQSIDYLIDGLFLLEQRDITLHLRGSRNQNVYKFDNKQKKWYNIDNKEEVLINGRN